jgi:anti-sigma regulatory factor (Ser/Thr protein kinase)
MSPRRPTDNRVKTGAGRWRRERLQLRVPARPSSLRPVRDAAREWLARAGVDDDTAYDLVVALNEACSNAVEHPVAARGGVEVDGVVASGEVVLSVRDSGRWRYPPAPGDRGRGLPMIRSLADAVDVHSSPNGTELRLRRRVG